MTALRGGLAEAGGDPARLDPTIPVGITASFELEMIRKGGILPAILAPLGAA